MLNKRLFAAKSGANQVNEAAGKAYGLGPRQALAQLALTGTLNDVFHADAESQLDQLLARCFDVSPQYVAKTAIYARQHGRMKDTPVVLLAWLASFGGEWCEAAFDRVVDSGAQLRNFVQGPLRSGLVARSSLGSRPKRLVQQWPERASDETLVHAMVGASPSLADVVKMVHPRAASIERSAFYRSCRSPSTRSRPASAITSIPGRIPRGRAGPDPVVRPGRRRDRRHRPDGLHAPARAADGAPEPVDDDPTVANDSAPIAAARNRRQATRKPEPRR